MAHREPRGSMVTLEPNVAPLPSTSSRGHIRGDTRHGRITQTTRQPDRTGWERDAHKTESTRLRQALRFSTAMRNRHFRNRALGRQPWAALQPAAGLACLLFGANAATIPGLFNTGVDASGALLSGGAVDPHWTIIQSADSSAPGPAAYVVRSGYPIPPWLDNGPDSRWIAPQAT